MPGNFIVALDVQPGVMPGYTTVIASDNSIYSYRYIGGTDGLGNVTVTHPGPQASIRISLTDESRYSIVDIKFGSDVNNQCSWHAGGHAHVAVITDKNSALAVVKYATIVKDTHVNCTINCDPIIKNVPV